MQQKMQSKLAKLAEEYISLDKSETGLEMKQLAEEGNEVLLKELLTNRIQFGTAGLRGEIGPGYSRMNDLVVIQATQGLLAYCLKTVADAKDKGVVIGHDHRHKSVSFAQLAAAVFLSKGFKVFYYPGLVHTPMVPFGVNQLGACAGIMITASHNPKQDNGYKVYWGNGCQIVPPVDEGIASAILENLVPWTWDKSLVNSSPLCSDPTEKMVKLYFEHLALQRQFPELKQAFVKVCYTPMHGVGLEFAKKAVSTFELADFVAVPSQMNPDPEFPTVKFPNPEEKGALDKAIDCALEYQCDIIFANDPDADRFACAEFQKTTGKWTVFTGNQIGILLASFVIEKYRKDGQLDKNLAVLTTAVSSHMLEDLAKVEGIYFDETLTGFKWLGNRAIELEGIGKNVVFAFEEVSLF
jgi:phosphomannomutase